MASDEEKQLGLTHGWGPLQTFPDSSDKGDVKHFGKSDSKLALSEHKALIIMQTLKVCFQYISPLSQIKETILATGRNEEIVRASSVC